MAEETRIYWYRNGMRRLVNRSTFELFAEFDLWCGCGLKSQSLFGTSAIHKTNDAKR